MTGARDAAERAWPIRAQPISRWGRAPADALSHRAQTGPVRGGAAGRVPPPRPQEPPHATRCVGLASGWWLGSSGATACPARKNACVSAASPPMLRSDLQLFGYGHIETAAESPPWGRRAPQTRPSHRRRRGLRPWKPARSDPLATRLVVTRSRSTLGRCHCRRSRFAARDRRARRRVRASGGAPRELASTH